ncbi:MAG: insulinase family protein [Prevotella sp.]|nr:insulinase family protein [Prevotella sp.]
MEFIKRTSCAMLLLLLSVTVSAGNKTEKGILKQDPQVRIGHLKNGLTYYICHNEEPRERAYFYIAQRVGALQEEPSQRGLAHFLEHMCFNGTTHFPGQGLRNYLESIGVKFGADLNAYTSVEETVYNIDNVPTTVDGAVDSCLLILHDWSHDLTLDPKEIDAERGVIQEEWRMRNSAQQRIGERQAAVLLKGSKYEDAMPIGSMDIVRTFQPDVLRAYYQKWYRPDLQAIIIVGDINVKEVEKKIKRVFADIPKPGKQAAKRIYYPVADNEQPLFFLGTDPEMRQASVNFYFKHDQWPRDQKNTREYRLANFYNGLISQAFRNRVNDISRKPDAPFTGASIGDGNFLIAQTKRAFRATASSRTEQGNVEQATEAMLRELFRLQRHGLTADEFERYRRERLRDPEANQGRGRRGGGGDDSDDQRAPGERRRQSRQFVNQCVRHFLDEAPLTTPKDEREFWKATLPGLTLDDANAYLASLFTGDTRNLAISVIGPKSDTIQYPDLQQLLAIYRRAAAEDLKPYEKEQKDTASTDLPFLPKEPVAGTIVSEETQDSITTWVLSNGMTVRVRPTSRRRDPIQVQSVAWGGWSQLPDSLYRYRGLIGSAVRGGGLGNYSQEDLRKKFEGTRVNVSSSVSEYQQSVNGSGNRRDLKALFERVHANFLYPRVDTVAYRQLIDRQKRSLRENAGRPQQVLSDSNRVVYYGSNPLAQPLRAEEYDLADSDSLLRLYKDRFADASAFTTFIVGSVDLDSIRPLVEQYLASLPALNRNEQIREVVPVVKGSRTSRFHQPQETPVANISIQYSAPGEFSHRQYLIGTILAYALNYTYTRTIREEAGIAYSVRASTSATDHPRRQWGANISFTTDPNHLDDGVRLVDEGLHLIASQGPTADDMAKAKEYLLKTHKTGLGRNNYWMQVLNFQWTHGEDISTNYEAQLESITAADVQQMARTIADGDRKAVLMTTGE